MQLTRFWSNMGILKKQSPKKIPKQATKGLHYPNSITFPSARSGLSQSKIPEDQMQNLISNQGLYKKAIALVRKCID